MRSLFLTGAALLLTIGVASAQTSSGSTGSMSNNSNRGASGQMSKSQIETSLKAEGYKNIKNWKQKNGDYTADAKRYGKDEDNLKISRQTGMVENQHKLTHGQVKDMLKDQGYSDVDNIKTNGNTITTKAKKNGHDHKLSIDAKTGMITEAE